MAIVKYKIDKMKDPTRQQIILPKKLKDKIREQSYETGLSISEIVRIALEDYFKRVDKDYGV